MRVYIGCGSGLDGDEDIGKMVVGYGDGFGYR